jgi:hypothetical protein
MVAMLISVGEGEGDIAGQRCRKANLSAKYDWPNAVRR